MIRLALIGCGTISPYHAQRYRTLGDRLKITACVDIERERAQNAAAQYGGVAATSVAEVLDEVDAVLIALPHHLHHEIGMQCLHAGKHVLMEKPLANSEADCLDLIGAAKENNVTLMVAYCMRFHPLLMRMKELIESKIYGETFHLSLWTEQLSQDSPGSWATRAATLGGGQLFSHGCHYIDLMLWMLGQPLSGTHTGTNFGTPWMEKEGTSDVSIKFENGAVGYHGGTWGARGSRLYWSFHAHTEGGMLEVDYAKGQLLLHRWDVEPEILLESEPYCKYMENEMAHFLSCIETGATPFTDGFDSLQGLRVIWRLYEAEAENRVADLRGLSLTNQGLETRFLETL